MDTRASLIRANALMRRFVSGLIVIHQKSAGVSCRGADAPFFHAWLHLLAVVGLTPRRGDLLLLLRSALKGIG